MNFFQRLQARVCAVSRLHRALRAQRMRASCVAFLRNKTLLKKALSETRAHQQPSWCAACRAHVAVRARRKAWSGSGSCPKVFFRKVLTAEKTVIRFRPNNGVATIKSGFYQEDSARRQTRFRPDGHHGGLGRRLLQENVPPQSRQACLRPGCRLFCGSRSSRIARWAATRRDPARRAWRVGGFPRVRYPRGFSLGCCT